MSKDAYYQFGPPGGKPVDGLNLPSFPTTSYWYNAHSSVGSSFYSNTETTGTPPFKGQQRVDAKLSENEREPLEWWTDGICLGNQPKNFDGQYWGGHATERGYAPPNDQSEVGSEFEPSDQPLVLLSCNAADCQEGYSSPEFMSTVDIPRHELDESSLCSDSVSSQEYSPASSNSNSVINKKHSPEPPTVADEHKRSQKRQKKEAKEKAKEDKRCGVCGDAARSMHFGGMACDSCKAFFRRSVQSGAYKSFQCPENKTCPISKQNRKVCQYCRFKKSQENGMEINWVMSETDRMVLWKNRLAKQRHVQEEKIKEEVYGDLPRSLNPKEADVLRNLVALQESTFKSIPYPEDCYGDSIEALANLFVCICKKLGMFYYKVEDFQDVCKIDQSLLLKNGIGMSIYLHGAYMYDYENEMWPSDCNKEALKIPPISMTTLRKFTVLPEAFDAIMKFYNKYAKELKDEILLVLICLIAFFQPDDPQFQNPQKIQEIQLKYLELLRRYLKAKEGDIGVKITFPKLLVGLADVKEILEFHSKVDIKPTINHQKISTHSTVKNQMLAVSELFKKASQGLLPEFASVLAVSEKRQPLWQCTSAVGRRKRQSTSVVVHGEQFYHPQTNKIFGADPRTDTIITNPMEQIDQFIRKHKLPSVQINEVIEYKDNYGSSKDYKRRLLDIEPERTTNMGDQCHSDRQLQLVPKDKNGVYNQPDSVDKKKAVEVLCDILQHISCADNEDLIQSLKQNLSPHLLTSLAQKLSP
ncbi:peroxisome proliferator-activated receptor alpha-like [Homarus americanus]|uniref:Vitamin D3 receptor B-like 2 n=1 Tax=Homarus americanus TaxID=6706 RepID=A0A8J5JSZ5_HOMAM|nr:peroxisome proliferator-activated receptor alpha-like [Homarus americanus]XP_042240457.1 peroxisome proliferator-activated receptor alpha-like [Homarus americanus]XP_042240458.1 peroxisome proliferator-activated receptor alpha-like [Homarus americanus]XP_042240459.1 peroxisome proliferator-activated receptor alpha-like [Homarus americanus]XP_042240460.1 peroxisome proliferator-activated receptor alpha-like [Homarus americanus]XP_042240461.1 peroxisome proliferator-activated receptor alpha-l